MEITWRKARIIAKLKMQTESSGCSGKSGKSALCSLLRTVFLLFMHTLRIFGNSDNRRILEEFKIDENLYSSLSEVKKSRDIIPKNKTKQNESNRNQAFVFKMYDELVSQCLLDF